MAYKAMKYRRQPEHILRLRPLEVPGVGIGSQICTHDHRIPLALKSSPDEQGEHTFHDGIFDAPTIERSDLPGIVGIDTLTQQSAIEYGIGLSSSDDIAAASQYPPDSRETTQVGTTQKLSKERRVHFADSSGTSGLGDKPTPQAEQHSYPTDSKERQNVRRRAEKERARLASVEPTKPKKRAFAIEGAHEDCGENL